MNICHQHSISIDNAMQRAEEICLRHKVKFTKLRQNILKLIWGNKIPLKAYEILETLKINFPSAKPITIYRTLDFLLTNKLIHKLETQNSFIPCSHPQSTEHHCYFIVCLKCNKVVEGCEDDLLKAIFNSLGDRHFIPSKIVLEIQGVCIDCQCVEAIIDA
jgi:Fur family zinc uptake transcriptional regulator